MRDVICDINNVGMVRQTRNEKLQLEKTDEIIFVRMVLPL